MIFQRLKYRLFNIPEKEIQLRNRGFLIQESSSKTVAHLQDIITIFAHGYRKVLNGNNPKNVCKEIISEYPEFSQGFAFEGVGFYYGMMDLIFPSKKSRLSEFVSTEFPQQDYIVSVGAGFALARVPWGLSMYKTFLSKLDPLLSWCLPDGYGFHQGFFSPQKYVHELKQPPKVFTEDEVQLFYSGLGRSLWWVACANVEKIAEYISRFPSHTHAELWSGVGVAFCYAGGVSADQLTKIESLSSAYYKDFLSGLPFAAKLRDKGENHCEWTHEVCLKATGRDAKELSNLITDIMATELKSIAKEDMYRGSKAYVEIRKKLSDSLSIENEYLLQQQNAG